MTATSHRIGALAATATTIYMCGNTSVPVIACYTAGAWIGSLFPDADIPYSKIGRRYLSILWPFYIVQYLIHLFAPRSYVDKTFRHRGALHSPMIWICIFLVFNFIFSKWNTMIPVFLLRGVMIGIISHLLLDYISGGIPLFLPFSTKKYKSMLYIRTGGMIEHIMSILLLAYSAFICFGCIA